MERADDRQEMITFHSLKSGEAVEVTKELIKAEELYRSARGTLKTYILAQQSDEKLLQLYGDSKFVKNKHTYDDGGEHLYFLAASYYEGYIAHSSGYPEAELFTPVDVWEDAAGELFEDIQSRFPEFEYEPWKLPRFEVPPKLDEFDPEHRLMLFSFFETSS